MSNFSGGQNQSYFGSPIINNSPTKAPGRQVQGVTTAVVYSVDNATNPKYCSLLINNQTPPTSWIWYLPIISGNWAVAGTPGFNYFWDGPLGTGGSIVTVDLDSKQVIGVTSGISTVAPTPYFSTVNTHQHVGNLNPPLYPALGPVTFGGVDHPYTYAFIAGSQIPLSPTITSGNIIASTFSPNVTLEVSGPYIGLYQQTIASLVAAQQYVVSPYSQIFVNFVSNVTAIGDFGPFLTDGTNTLYFNINQAFSLFYNGNYVGGFSIPPNTLLNAKHTFTIMAENLGGTTWRYILLIDGIIYVDFSSGEFSLISSKVSGGFNGPVNNVYHADYNVWGYDNITTLEENPNPSTAPIPTSISSITYPRVGGALYNAQISFSLPAGYPGWCEGLKLQLTPHSSSPSTGDPFVVIALQPTGSYTALWPDATYGNSYDLYVGFQDNNATPSALYLIGTTVTNPTGGSNINPADVPVISTNPTAPAIISTGAHFDAIVNIGLTNTGTTSSNWLASIEMTAVPTGTSNTPIIYGVCAPNASGNYQFVWTRLPYEEQDLYIRFVDEEGNISAATKVCTVQPFTITEVQPFSFLPPLPTFDSGATGIVPYANVQGILQDFDCNITLTNVPQDQSVDRFMWAIRRSPTPSSTVPGQGGAYIKNIIQQGRENGAVRVAFTTTNAPSPGDLVLIPYNADVNINVVQAGWTIAGSIINGINVAGMVYKVWTGTDSLTQDVIDQSSGANATSEVIYIVGGVNQSSPIVQFESAAPTSSATLTFGSLAPTETSILPIAAIFANTFQPTLGGAPTVASGFTYDGYASSSFFGSVYTVMSFGGSLLPGLTAINPSFTVPTSLSPGTTGADLFGMMVFIRSSDPGGVTPGVIFPWIYVTETPLEDLPTPPTINSINYSYGQVSTGIDYDFGGSYVSKNNLVGPIGVFESRYTASNLKVTNQYLEGGVAYIPQVSPGIPSSIAQPSPVSVGLGTISVSGNTSTVTFGTAAALGELIIVAFAFDALTAGSSVSPPDGTWITEVAPTISTDEAYPGALVIFSKVALASEPLTYSFMWGNGDAMTDMLVSGYAEIWQSYGALLVQTSQNGANNDIQQSAKIITSETNSTPIHFCSFDGTYTGVNSLPNWTIVTSGVGSLQVEKGPLVGNGPTTIQGILTFTGAAGNQSGYNALLVIQPVPGSGAVPPVVTGNNDNGLTSNYTVSFQFLNQPLDGSSLQNFRSLVSDSFTEFYDNHRMDSLWRYSSIRCRRYFRYLTSYWKLFV